jgi:hypothetical protein
LWFPIIFLGACVAGDALGIEIWGAHIAPAVKRALHTDVAIVVIRQPGIYFAIAGGTDALALAHVAEKEPIFSLDVA